jgi:hypothetical protein
MAGKKFKKVCKCENCGNEAEMVITCSLDEEADQTPLKAQSNERSENQRVKGHGVCSSCGNEADMWVDLGP